MDEDAVFRAPPQRFTAARDELAAALKAQGRSEEAKAVKAWRRPALPVWLWNRLILDGEESAREAARLAAILGEAIEGEAGEQVAARIAELRAAGAELVSRARQVASEAGVGFSTAQERELTELVQALPFSREAREQAARGRLREPPPPVDPLEAMRFLAGAAPLPPEPKVENQARAQAQAALAQAQAALQQSQSAHEAAEKARQHALAGVARAEKVLADAERQVVETLGEQRSRALAVDEARRALTSLEDERKDST